MANPPSPREQWVRLGLLIAGGLMAGSLVWRYANTPIGDAVASVTGGVLDLGVGLAFVAAGALAPGAAWERLWVGATGIAWMTATWMPSLSGVHQGLLIAAVVLFAGGVPQSAGQWAAAAAAALVMLGLWPQPFVAGVFFVAAAYAMRGGRMRRRVNAFPALAAGLVGTSLGLAWIAGRLDPATFRPVVGLRLYEVALLVAAPLLAVGLSRARRPGVMTDTLLRDGSSAGLAGLERLLRAVFGDPELAIIRKGPEATVTSTSPLLRDADTERAVDEAVRLAARHATLTASLEQQRVDVEAANRRLVTSVDRRRAVVARRLRREVLVPLAESEGRLRRARDRVDETQAAEAIDIALREVEAAQRDVTGMVRGVPPVTLGGGRIRGALADLASSAGATVSVHADERAKGDEAAELTLFYVCSEALTNALRHSGASRIEVALTVIGDTHLHLVVRDDGRGGAAPYPGSGLEGLVDRVSATGGELQIASTPRGTSVTVRLPITTPAARAGA